MLALRLGRRQTQSETIELPDISLYPVSKINNRVAPEMDSSPLTTSRNFPNSEEFRQYLIRDRNLIMCIFAFCGCLVLASMAGMGYFAMRFHHDSPSSEEKFMTITATPPACTTGIDPSPTVRLQNDSSVTMVTAVLSSSLVDVINPEITAVTSETEINSSTTTQTYDATTIIYSTATPTYTPNTQMSTRATSTYTSTTPISINTTPPYITISPISITTTPTIATSLQMHSTPTPTSKTATPSSTTTTPNYTTDTDQAIDWLVCGPELYDSNTHMCCSDIVVKRLDGVGTAEEKCCGTNVIDVRTHICCEEQVNIRVDSFTKCCLGTTFNSASEMCCKGIIQARITASYRCCASAPYDYSTHRCVKYKVQPK